MIQVTGNRKTTLFLLRALLVCSLIVMCLARQARADTVYTYTGNLFNVFFGGYACNNGVGECRVTGKFAVAQPLAASLSNQQFPPMALMSYVTMMSEPSAGDLTSIWL